jgi:hypothetical protein
MMELNYNAGNTISYHSGTFQRFTFNKVETKAGKAG